MADALARALGVAPEGVGRAVGIEVAAAAIFALVPAWLFVGPVGPFRAPGLEGEGLYGQLFAGAMVRRWVTGGASPGVADIAGDTVWWPVSPLASGLQAAIPLDPAWALGCVVAFAVWLAGYGPWRLARRVFPTAPLWGALFAGLAAQTSPVVLRALPGVDLAALAVGAIALGLAHPRAAWVGGLWSAPGALVFGIAGLLGRRPAWLIAALPALALLLPASSLPAAMRPAAAPSPTSPGYLTDEGATFPLPPEEQTAVLEAAQLTRTGLWIPAEVSPQVRGNLFLGPPPTPGSTPGGAPAQGDGGSASWGGALPRNAPPGGEGPLDPQQGVTQGPSGAGFTPMGTPLPGPEAAAGGDPKPTDAPPIPALTAPTPALTAPTPALPAPTPALTAPTPALTAPTP
ncbi:MAG: hypothetical protein Q8P41_17535, partial [Pseudomonadota bacterium]|nr:hypothetical protein [Pseudomonadota bacterium]